MQIFLYRSISVALFSAVIAGAWDVWWHGALGRESFFSPPHILLYLSIAVAVSFGFWGWYKTREYVWKKLALLLLLIPLSAPLDEIWHRIFGIEDPSSPLIIWSPPHIILILSIVGSFYMLIPIIERDGNKNAIRIFLPLALASILHTLSFLVSPFQPFSPYSLFGFWGAGIGTFLFVLILFFAKRLVPDLGGATLVTLFLVLLTAFNFGEQLAPGVVIKPHPHPPGWLMIFSIIAPALFLDLFPKVKRSSFAVGGVVGGFSVAILYGFASNFFDPVFQYSREDALIAVVAGIIGGLLASGTYLYTVYTSAPLSGPLASTE